MPDLDKVSVTVPTSEEKAKFSDRLKKYKRALALPIEQKTPEMYEANYLDFARKKAPLGTYDSSKNTIYLNRDIKENPIRNEVLIHELQHSQEGHSPDESDLMYAHFTPELNQENYKSRLSEKLKNKAIQNLEKQESELVDPNLPVHPKPIREVYQEIASKKPVTKKPYWWED